MARVRYTILRKIADGGMAEIYLGTQHGAAGFERPIVIKHIRREFALNPQFRTMLVDEAHIAMGLNHGNIVQVLDLGTQEGHFYQVLELVDGWDCDTLVRRALATSSKSIPPALALHITAQVCRALGYAHSRQRDGTPLKIVHRDVSPENILVSAQGEVKLADFGIATAINKQDRTSAGVVKGKLGFMSPEQANGKPLDGRSDLYALGCALYVMVLGTRPFVGKTELEILLKQQDGAFVPPLDVAPDLHPDVVALLQRAMDKDPDKRWADADGMLAEVERVQRAVFTPAGQTELKQWLESLFATDAVPSTANRPPPLKKPHIPGELPPEEIPEGSALILQEISDDGLVRDTVAELELPGKRQSPSWAVGAAGMAAVGMVMVGAWFILGGGGPGGAATPGKDPVAGVPDASVPVVLPTPPPSSGTLTTQVADAGTTAVMTGAFGDGGIARDAGTVVPRDGGGGSQDASAAVAAAAPRDAGERSVDFGDDGASQAPSLDGGRTRGVDAVSVRFVSDPVGATIIVNGKEFGVAPLSIKFKPGLTHDVVFRKEGHVDQSRRVYVSQLRNQSVQVTLPKAAPTGSKKKKWWPF